ncbi:2Fe-2S ferredoxin [Rhodoblastus acidophilus]|uniref:2Fe-2S iron-sulfur cluster-binding protein n=1 Tax=Rhodoblastus acidophilus TaxID=1074 RepID=UPI00161FDC57|nr:2Fe-2S iron-sulfur cluster-binding protein [Rhodoblastus acidophilus]MCW2284988.1 2Fe-2S ferredoxin [Rhodoblastus acidophilus]MCW2333948.1 2Fe-2S ferredoxin [Rhodoblastus acidophilus]
MVKVIFVNTKGEKRELEGQPGQTAMEIARNAGVEEIYAECGGACACATCHVYVAKEWADKLPKPEPMESDMLDFAVDPRPTSRLSCQIKLSDELDGLVLELPASQG